MILQPECNNLLFEIINLLESGGERSFAAAVKSEIGASDEALSPFLVSNELWGGPGSLADSAFAYYVREAFGQEDDITMLTLARVPVLAFPDV